MIATHNGYGDVQPIDIGDYPAVKEHLDRFSPKLEKRLDKGNTPYNLRNCTYYGDFAKEKLFWMDMSPEGRFTYLEEEVFCNNKGFMMSGEHLKYLCAVLNSNLIRWYMKNTARTTGMGLMQWEKFAVERLSIPRVGTEEQQVLIEAVDEILSAKSTNRVADTHHLERSIDDLVYTLYGLTEREITAIERSLGLIHVTDEEEDAALLKILEDSQTEERVSREEVMQILESRDAG